MNVSTSGSARSRHSVEWFSTAVCRRSTDRRASAWPRRAFREKALVLLALAAVFAVTFPASAAVETIPAGSLIIPMDVTYQNIGMFKAYGLVYTLLNNGVQVDWAIQRPKTFGAVDFTATTSDLKTGAPVNGGSPYGYAGGPFIVEQPYVAAATPIINAFWAAQGGQPAIHVATASFSTNIDIKLKRAPRIALESINSGIAIAYFNAAGILDANGNRWSSTSPGIMTDDLIANGALFESGACSQRKYDVFITPHNSGYAYSLTDPTNLGTRTYAALDYFVFQGGGWIALCHSILSNENNIADLYKNGSPSVRALFYSTQNTGFLTDSGFTTIDNKGGTWTVPPASAALPIAQAVPTPGAVQTLPGGSVQTWNRNTVTYLPGVENVAWFNLSGTIYDWAVNGVYHGGDGRGKLTFLGGHSYSTSVPYSTNYEAPYLRFFYNGLFFNGAAVAKLDLVTNPTSVSQGKLTNVAISMTNTGGSTATSVSGVSIVLSSGVTYLSTSGPAPTVTPNSPSPGQTTLTWPSNPFGNVAGGSTPVTINTQVLYPTAGTYQVATLAATYGDVLSESFRTQACQSLVVTPAPKPALLKTPATQGPFYPGQTVSWTLSYSNAGAATLFNPIVEDILPAGWSYASATPAATSVVPLQDGTTRIRWSLADLAAGGSGTITLRAVAPSVTSTTTFTNNATLTGTDANGSSYTASASAQVTLQPPPVSVGKSVNLASANQGDTLTYTIRPRSTNSTPLLNARVIDVVPAYTTYKANSAGQGGVYGAYVPIPREDGIDTSPATTLVMTTSASTAALGDTITVTMALTNTSGLSITSITPASLTVNAGSATCSGPSPAGPFALANNATQNVTYSCTMTSLGEPTFTGAASGTWSGAPYDFTPGTSASVLVTTSGGSNVVTWQLGSNAEAQDGEYFLAGNGAGIYALRGNNSNNFWRYAVGTNTWVTRANTPAAVEEGGALTYDGGGYYSGFLYALRGNNTNNFWRYDIDLDTWASMANTPGNVKDGGALIFLNGRVYAFRGGDLTDFWSYNPATNTWTTLAAAPGTVNVGGALTTDGTNLYAFRGDNTNAFWRYNVASNTWTVLANAPAAIKRGGALTRIGNYIYATRGTNTTTFWRYDIAANTWTTLKNLPGAVEEGGALTTDGTHVFCLRGNGKKDFYRYDPVTNLWASQSQTLANVGGNGGGALAYVPATSAADRSTSLKAAPALVTTGDTITVTMTLTAGATITGATPSALTVIGTNGASATCGAASPASATVAPGAPATFTWTCAATAGATPGDVKFQAGATGGSGQFFANGTSNTVLVSPPLTYQTIINNPVPSSVNQITNYAMIVDDDSAQFAQGSNPALTTILRPSLSIVKSVSPIGTVTSSQTLTYTLVVENDGTAPATNVMVSDPIPTNTTYVASSCSVPPGGRCQHTGGAVTFDQFTLGAQQSLSLTFQVTVNNLAIGSYTVSNTASVSSAEVATPVPSNTVTTPVVVQPTMTIVKSQASNHTPVSTEVVSPGDTITYTLLVTNTSSVSISNVAVSDSIPPGTTYVASSVTCAKLNPAAGCGQTVAGPDPLVVTVPTLAASQQASITFQVTVNSPPGTAGQTILEDGDIVPNKATVAATGSVTPVTSNTVSYRVQAAPLVTVTKSASPAGGTVVSPGDVITYTILVTNLGTMNSPDAYISDSIPANTTYVTGSTYLNGTQVTELTPGVPPLAGGMTVYTPGTADQDGDGGLLLVGAANKATVTFSVLVNSPLDNSTVISNVATAGTASTAPVTSSPPVTHTVYSTPVLSVAKSVSPSGAAYPGQRLTYTLTITNTGKMTATGVTLSDAIPANSTYVANSASGGGVYNSGSNTVTWSGLTIAPGTPITVTFAVTARADITGYSISNTAFVSYTAYSNQNLSSAFTATPSSNTTSTPVLIPTAVELRTIDVLQEKNKVLVTWETSWEADNLGFNVWREEHGVRTQVNKQLIAGSALVTRHQIASNADRGYRLKDKLPSDTASVQYWLEDVDLDGTRTMHGPVRPRSASITDERESVALPGLGADGGGLVSPAGVGVVRSKTLGDTDPAQYDAQLGLAGSAGLKLYVSREGWYRVTKAAMVSAGFDPGANPRRLALHTTGIEQAIWVDDGGDGKFDADDAIEFFGIGLDITSTGARTYWLGLSDAASARLGIANESGPAFAESVPFTFERVDRTVYAAALTNNGDGENFFGPVITPSPVTQSLTVSNLDSSWSGSATLELSIQGLTDVRHVIAIRLNGFPVGTIGLDPTELGQLSFDIPHAWLQLGANTIELRAQNGWYDVSLLAAARLVYRHLLRADDGLLEVELPPLRQVTVDGFRSSRIRAIDVTDPSQPVILPVATGSGSAFTATFTTPWSTGPRTVLVLDDARVLQPEAIANRPSSWASKGEQQKADLVIVTNSAFADAADALATARNASGIRAFVVDVEDLYDEYNFGTRGPVALRRFFEAASRWRKPLRFAVLIGDASLDPRNYVGAGSFDFVPTKMIPTIYLKTSSDGWFTDFDGDGVEDIAIGRLPARTADDATLMVNKTIARERSLSVMKVGLFIADTPNTYDFEGAVSGLATLVPSSIQTQIINIARTTSPRGAIVSALNAGPLFVDYVGHASTEVWSNGVFSSTNALALTNGDRLPVVFAMGCLSGYFHDLFSKSLAESLLRAPGGGAAAVWASSGLTDPSGQMVMNREALRLMVGPGRLTIGEAVMAAKRVAPSRDTRSTWMLFGDPSMSLQ